MTEPHIVSQVAIPMEASPLTWPTSVPRTKHPTHSRFHAPTINAGINEIREELRMLGAQNVIISSNLPLRLNGEPRASGLSANEDQGAAVYWFLLKKQEKVPYCLPCDKWRMLADNLHAIGLTIRALRAVERYGAIHVVQAFEGFKALPNGDGSAPIMPIMIDWKKVLGAPPSGCSKGEQLLIIKSRYRALIKMSHPDGADNPDATRAAELNGAWEAAEKELGSL